MIPVYVPAEGKLAHLKKGSGIVGEPRDENILIYYEGNVFGYSNIVTYADRVYHAYDRMRQHYPTVACEIVRPECLVRVGAYDPGSGCVLVTDLTAVTAWLDAEPTHEELCRS